MSASARARGPGRRGGRGLGSRPVLARSLPAKTQRSRRTVRVPHPPGMPDATEQRSSVAPGPAPSPCVRPSLARTDGSPYGKGVPRGRSIARALARVPSISTLGGISDGGRGAGEGSPPLQVAQNSRLHDEMSRQKSHAVRAASGKECTWHGYRLLRPDKVRTEAIREQSHSLHETFLLGYGSVERGDPLPRPGALLRTGGISAKERKRRLGGGKTSGKTSAYIGRGGRQPITPMSKTKMAFCFETGVGGWRPFDGI